MLCYSVCNPTVNKHGKNQKSNERGYPMIERIEYQYILYNTKKNTCNYNISHYALRPKSPSKNNAATPSPGRSSHRPRIRSLNVVSLRSATG